MPKSTKKVVCGCDLEPTTVTSYSLHLLVAEPSFTLLGHCIQEIAKSNERSGEIHDMCTTKHVGVNDNSLQHDCLLVAIFVMDAQYEWRQRQRELRAPPNLGVL